jgi:hypothetical protein
MNTSKSYIPIIVKLIRRLRELTLTAESSKITDDIWLSNYQTQNSLPNIVPEMNDAEELLWKNKLTEDIAISLEKRKLLAQQEIYSLQKKIVPKIANMKFEEWQTHNLNIYTNKLQGHNFDEDSYYKWLGYIYKKLTIYNKLQDSINTDMTAIFSSSSNQHMADLNKIYNTLLLYTYKADENEIANYNEVNEQLKEIHKLLLKLTSSSNPIISQNAANAETQSESS